MSAATVLDWFAPDAIIMWYARAYAILKRANAVKAADATPLGLRRTRAMIARLPTMEFTDA